MAYEGTNGADNGSSPDLDDIATQTRRYLIEPAEHSWVEVMAALRRALGEDGTDDLVQAFEIRVRSSRRIG